MAVVLNPPRVPIVDVEGRPTPEFYRYLVEIQGRVGGVSNPFDDAMLLGSPPSLAQGISSNDTLPPPVIPVTLDDVLPPPTIPVQVDDLMVPPRFGV